LHGCHCIKNELALKKGKRESLILGSFYKKVDVSQDDILYVTE